MDRIEELKRLYFPGKSDALLITAPVNRRYLLDFPSSAGTLLILPESQYFIIDFRYFEKAREVVKNCTVLLQDQLYHQINEIFSQNHVRTVGLEDHSVTLHALAVYREKLSAVPVEGSGLSELLEEIRYTKSDEELARLEKAQQITDQAFTEILSYLRPGISEKEIALELEYRMKRLGADGLSFDTIAVAGKNSSLPHGVPSDYRVQNGDFITMDFGALLDGYHADMTRTVALGEISAEQKKVYHTVREAQQIALDMIKAGLCCYDIDKAARDFIYSSGYEDCFGHGLGHSVGLEIHEEPRFSPACHTILQEGMVLSVEPGVYLPGKFGVRIEDLVIIEKDGIRDLTKSRKDLICL